jgi:hypothetical protein
MRLTFHDHVNELPHKTKKMRIDFRAVSQLYLGNYPTVRLFKEHFGATPEVTSGTWEWLVVTDTLPQNGYSIGGRATSSWVLVANF